MSVSASIISCEVDYLDEKAQSDMESLEIRVLNNRMYFPNKEIFVETFKKYADESNDEIYKFINKYYDGDFSSLRIPATESNEEMVFNKYKKRIERFSNDYGYSRYEGDIYDDIDDLEEIIGDEAFSAFLNEKAEIQVGNIIYKYTDVGLFYATVENYNVLDHYLEIMNVSKDLLVSTEEGARQGIERSIPNTGETILENGTLFYFIAPCANGSDPFSQQRCATMIGGGSTGTGGSGGTSGGGNGGGGQTQPLDGLQPFLDNLNNCNSRNGLFGTLFGTNKICIDKYESDHRVKTKVFNYNYYLVYHIGAKVKHQKKGWTGIWRQQDTDVVAAGIEMAQFEYDYTPILQPDLGRINQNEFNYAYKPLNIRYNVNTSIWDNPYGNAPFTFIRSETFISNNFYPRVFWDDLIIESYGNNNIVDWAIGLADKQLTSDNLNKLFWNELYKNVRNQLKNLTNNNGFEPPQNITLISNHPRYGKLLVQKSYYSNCSNCSKRDKTFDFDGAAQVGISFNGNNGKFSYSGGAGQLVLPKSMKVKMYGVAKRNGVWHGSKIEVGLD